MKNVVQVLLVTLAFVITCGLWPPPATSRANAAEREAARGVCKDAR